MELGSLVWFDPGVDSLYALPGRVRESVGTGLRIECPVDGKTYEILNPQNNVRVRHDNLESQDIDDMILLRDLHEGSILFNLQTRYEKANIYTYTGSILVAVNPYRLFDIYGLDTVKQYEGQRIGQLPPHLFAIGAGAYSRMIEANRNQCVIISGESGAGKTESTKLIMQYLAAVNSDQSNMTTEQILEANPLLESFGNAKTIKNDNSSRFGKYSEVFYNKSGIISGAKTTDYLLEKSRIVRQAPGERNYHVFYEMLAGMSTAEKAKLGLYDAEKYYYLNQGSRSSRIEGKPDSEDFLSLTRALEILSFSPVEQDTIFGILAAILHLGNVTFQAAQFGSSEGLVIQNQPTIKQAAKFLYLQSEHLERAITFRLIEARGESTLIPRTFDQAIEARDGIAKSLYSTLFAWLVGSINNIVADRHEGVRLTSIAILDIFGFEVFEVNSFEQLCINFANERLQYFFNKHIFELEQREYAQERIEWSSITYIDNQLCLDLISKRPIGILHILDDESAFPKGSDKTFLDKCHYQHIGNAYYEKPKMDIMEFGIKHFAGKVSYTADHFLAKNKDTLKQDVMSMFINCRSKIISDMFSALQEQEEQAMTIAGRGRYVSPMRKMRSSTIATKFQESLQELIEKMSKCNPYFVRCLKPNENKAPMQFDSKLVLKQLRYSGMLETIRIRKAGYPIRLTFNNFYNRYRFMKEVSLIPRDTPYSHVCQLILQRSVQLFIREQMAFQQQAGEVNTSVLYRIGTTKVFLKEILESYLEYHRRKILHKAVIVIQRMTRGHLARKNLLRERVAAILVQSKIRQWLARSRYKKLRKGVVRLQAQFRGNKQRDRFKKMVRANRVKIQEEDRKMREVQMLRAQQQGSSTHPAIAVSHLDIPYELSCIFDKVIDWSPPHAERNIIKVVGQVALHDYTFSFPHDIDSHPFSKYANIYFKRAHFGMLPHPIVSAFHRLNDKDDQDAVAIFKLIQRFMMEESPSKDHEFVLGNYIAQKGISSRALRDEIFCQLCNQTWNNGNSLANEKAWLLLTNLLGAFPPSKRLYKYLLKYMSDHAYNGYKSFCQHKLLKCDSEAVTSELSRTYPPCLLEWKVNRLRANMALELKSADGENVKVQLESWTTGEEFAMTALKKRGIIKGCHGWSVYLSEDNHRYELPGFDYVLDLISEMELPPELPVQESSFLVSSELIQERVPRRRMANMVVKKTLEEIVHTQPPVASSEQVDTNVPRPGKGHRYIQQPAGRVPPQSKGSNSQYPDRQSSSHNEDYLIPTADYNQQDLHRGPSNRPAYHVPSNQPRPHPDYPGTDGYSQSVGTSINNVPIPDDTSQADLENFVDSVFSPLVQMQDGVDDLTDPMLVNQALKGGGTGPRPPSPIPGRTANYSSSHKLLPASDEHDDDDNDSIGPEMHASSPPPLPAATQHAPPDISPPPPPIIISTPPHTARHVTPPSTIRQPHLNRSNIPPPRYSLKGSSYNQRPQGNAPNVAGGATPGMVGAYDPNLMAQMGPLSPNAYGAPDMNYQVPMMAYQQQQQLMMQQAVANQQILAQQRQIQQQQEMLQKVQQQLQQNPSQPQSHKSSAPSSNHHSHRRHSPQSQASASSQPPLKSAMIKGSASGSSSGESSAATTPSSKKKSLHFDSSVVTIPGRQGDMAVKSKLQPATPSPPLQNGMSAPPPPPPPPPPMYTDEQVGLINMGGKAIYLEDDVRDRARTVRVREVVWPPRKSQQAKEGNLPERNIAEVARGARPGVHRVSVEDLQQRAQNLRQVPGRNPEVGAGAKSAKSGVHQVSVEDLQQQAQSLRQVSPQKARPHSYPGPRLKVTTKVATPAPSKPAFVKGHKRTPSFEKPPDVHQEAMQKIRAQQKILGTTSPPPPPLPPPSPVQDLSPRSPLPRSPSPRSPLPSTPLPRTPTPPVFPPPPTEAELIANRQSVINKDGRIAAGRQSKEAKKAAMTAQAHSEALNILKSKGIQMQTVTSSHPQVALPRNPPPAHSPVPPPVPVPTSAPMPLGMSDRDIHELENAMTKMYPTNHEVFYTYNRVKWSLNLRKEVFTPGEKMDNPTAQHLVFCQIIMDTFSNSCIRMSKEEKRTMQQIMESMMITDGIISNLHNIGLNSTMKRQVIGAARKFPLYFTRFFPVSGGRKNPYVEMIGVSHAGVMLVRREMNPEKDQLHIIDSFLFSEIMEVKVTSSGIIRLFLAGDTVIPLYTVRAAQIQSMIKAYIIDLQRDSEHVRAIQDYITHESTLLSFHKGDIIKVNPRQQMIESDWLYGMLDGKAGYFPNELVEPVAGPEGARLYRGRKAELPTEQANIPNTIDEISVMPPQPAPVQVSDEELYRLSMIEFAMKNFRPNHHKYKMQYKLDGSISGSLRFMGSKSKKGSKARKLKEKDAMTQQEYENLVTYSNSPIQVSLIETPNNALNKLALQCFIALMQIMGDYPLKLKPNMTRESAIYQCVATILKACFDHPVIVDEVYCQVIKQITNNTSTKESSCIQGWRLLYLLSAFFKCSDKMKPYLRQYLTTNTTVRQPQFVNIATMCVLNLRKTFRFDGRKAIPGMEEVNQIMLGRFVLRQPFMLPGNILMNLKVGASTIVAEIVESVCAEIGVTQAGFVQEFGLFVFQKSTKMALQPSTFIMDITNHYEKQDQQCALVCKKVIWQLPIKLDNERLVQVMYNQIEPDYLSGHYLILGSSELSDNQIREYVKLAALQLKAMDQMQIPTMGDLPKILPSSILEKYEMSQWLNWIHEERTSLGSMPPHNARSEFIHTLMSWQLFGSTFFRIKSISDDRIKGECIMAINKDGVHFVNMHHRLIQKTIFRNIISTRRLRSKAKQYVEMKCGDLMRQTVIRLETDQGEEISVLITRYIQSQPRPPPRIEEPDPTGQHLIQRQESSGQSSNSTDVAHLGHPRPSYVPSVGGSTGSSTYDDEHGSRLKISLPPAADTNNNEDDDERELIINGKKTYSRQRLELARKQEEKTVEQKQQENQLQRQLRGRLGLESQGQQIPQQPAPQQQWPPQQHVPQQRLPQQQFPPQQQLPTQQPGYERQTSGVPNGDAGIQRANSKKVGRGGGGNILRRGLPSRKQRPMSMPPQSTTTDGFKIQLPPQEY